MGEKPSNIESEKADWQGAWVTQYGALLFVEVIDPSKGILRVGELACDEAAHSLKYETTEVYLGDGPNWRYATPQLKQDKPAERYLWARIQKTGNFVLVWYPDVSTFANLVRDGTLPGFVNDDGDVFLGDLTSDHFEIIEGKRKDYLFNMDPQVLFRVSDWKPPLCPLETVPQ
jgi:hypothetical protein